MMLLGFASFPIFTRVFSVGDYGTLNLIQNTVLLLTVVAKFGFQHSVQRYYPEYANAADPLVVRRYYSTLFFGTGLNGLFLTLLFVAAVALGLGRFLGITATGTLLLACPLILIRALRSMQLNLMQMEDKTRLYNILEIFQKAGVIGLTVVLLFTWQKTIVACFIGMIAIELLVIAQNIFPLVRRRLISAKLFDFGFLRAAVVFSFPLFLAEISWIVLNAGDRFFVQYYLGAVAVGYYAAAYGIATYVQEVMTVPLQLSFFPICMKLWAAEGKEATQRFLNRSLNFFLMVSVLVVCVAIVTSGDVVIVLASKKFHEAHTLLPFLVIGLVLTAMNIFFRPGLMIHKRVRKIAQATFVATVLNIVLNIVLLPKIGIMGAAVATTLSFLAQVFLMGYESLRILPFKLEWLALARYLVVGTAAAWIASLLQVGPPLAAAALKGSVILILYTGGLWLSDRQAREAIHKLISMIVQFLRRPKSAVKQLTVAAEN